MGDWFDVKENRPLPIIYWLRSPRKTPNSPAQLFSPNQRALSLYVAPTLVVWFDKGTGGARVAQKRPGKMLNQIVRPTHKPTPPCLRSKHLLGTYIINSCFNCLPKGRGPVGFKVEEVSRTFKET